MAPRRAIRTGRDAASTDSEQFLQPQSQKAIESIMGTLRSLGVQRGVEFPRIVVVGDQSARESSSLEAIANVKFPIKHNLRTRLITELVLRHSNEHSRDRCDVSIILQKDRSHEGLKKYDRISIRDQEEFDMVVNDTEFQLNIATDQPGICGGVLRIEISGPSQIDLTMADIPGYFNADSETQVPRDLQLADTLTQSYLRAGHNIIIAVVSAENESDLQRVADITRQIDDLLGDRKFGLITKLDTLNHGSVSERRYFRLAQNKHGMHRLEWHVLRNRSFQDMHTTDEERDGAEDEFFNQSLWKFLPASRKGVSRLRSRLGKILDDHLRSQLHDVELEVYALLIKNYRMLEKLGPPRRDSAEQRKYLIEASIQFTEIVDAAISGNYHQHELLRDQNHLRGGSMRLRAVIEKTLAKFALDMQSHGQAKRIVDEVTEANDKDVLRKNYSVSVRNMTWLMKGREFPGTFNSLVISELFREQSTPWRKIATDCARRLLELATDALKTVFQSILDEDASAKIWEYLMDQNLYHLRQELMKKIDEILQPRNLGYAITYNPSVTESVWEMHIKRCKERMKHVLGTYENMRETCSLEECLDKVVQTYEPDMETSASLSAADWAEAYYKIALDQFVDEFSRLAIVDCLMMKLPSLFTIEMVYNMDDETLELVAGEEWVFTGMRVMLEKDKCALEIGLKDLRRLLKDNGILDFSPVVGASNLEEVSPTVEIPSRLTPAPARRSRDRQIDKDREHRRQRSRDYGDKDLRSHRARENNHSTGDQDNGDKQVVRRGGPLPSQADSFALTTGEEPPKPKEKPNYSNSGALAAASNSVTQADGSTIVLKYHEPPEARKPSPKDQWKLFVFKGEDIIDTIPLSNRSCWLVGRDMTVVDMTAEHPSVSKQHAVIQFRYTEKRNEYGDKLGKVKPYLIDLESANGTLLNSKKVPQSRYLELREKDMIQFGQSTREYVLMLAPKD
ncbi:hypothetical protein O1611_g4573 [Lasiodiplodia mahajangana]|uniref:Uncharacterized protein n=1 Tax=Lasiodiplodia mahajangana TaxID=1108764 RepID=A0ACC2JP82_9PEZI|nr:hypothetical protein O1611_g4573 [Lasiodiplodia mahajangana]